MLSLFLFEGLLFRSNLFSMYRLSLLHRRYLLLHDRIEEASESAGKIDVEEAVGILSLLGIKGSDYGSCEASNFLTGDPSHVLSVLYDPSKESIYVAWEDGNVTKGPHANWRPAGCNEYLYFNMSEWW
jgi:hypothetical protein